MTALQLGWAALARVTSAIGVVAGLGMALTVPSAAPHALAGEPSPTPFVQVRIDQVTPDVVTTSSEPHVTVSGTVTNTGDRPVRDVMVRLEHAAAVTSSTALRTSLDGGTDQYQPAADFLTVAPELDRGQEAGFTLSAPLRSLTRPSLAVNQPGSTRSWSTSMGHPTTVRLRGSTMRGSCCPWSECHPTRPPTSAPLLHQKRRRRSGSPCCGRWPTGPGWPRGTRWHRSRPAGRRRPGKLAGQRRPAGHPPVGGRVRHQPGSRPRRRRRPSAVPGHRPRSTHHRQCDDRRLRRVRLARRGRSTTGHPDPPGHRPGRRIQLAGSIADASPPDMRDAAAFAQADLDALQRVNDPRLSAIATISPADIVDRILDVSSTRGATVLPDGPLTGRAINLLSTHGNTVAVAAADFSPEEQQGSSQIGSALLPATAPRRLSPRVVAAPFDPAVGAALAAAGTNPTVPTYLDPSLFVRIAHESITARRQDALGAMLWRSLEPNAAPRTQILVPPASWSLASDDAQVILTALATAIRSGLAVPRPLPAVIADAAARTEPPEPRALTAPLAAGSMTTSPRRSAGRLPGYGS